LQALCAIGLVAFSNVPKYGGEKLFMPFFPFFCALAADGLRIVGGSVFELAPRLRTVRVASIAVPVAVLVLAALPGALGTAKHHGGYALSYYGELVGGLRGAVARGYERTYYDVADKPLARQLDAMLDVKSVCFEPNAKEYVRTYRWLKRDGVISPRLSVERDCRNSDVVVLTHERRWTSYPSKRAELSADRVVVSEKRIDGVPLYTVFARR
jgi:hypothetical protein